MKEKIRNSYEHTIYACYIGYITQAIVNNFVPLLFLTFVREMDLTLGRITLLTSEWSINKESVFLMTVEGFPSVDGTLLVAVADEAAFPHFGFYSLDFSK